MGLGYIFFLAVLQGFTEFLPISSSAHLILPSHLFNLPDQGLAFDVSVHVGTLTAVLLYFYKDFWQLLVAWCRSITGGGHTEQSRLAWALIVGTIPAGILGLLLNHIVENYMRSTLVIAAATLVFGVLLWYADATRKEVRTQSQLTLKDALYIGLAQAVALIPGTSRSGITITAGLMLGLTRNAAARFSFYLSVPLIMAAGSLKGLEIYQQNNPAEWHAVIIGAVISAISAYICIHWFLKLLDKVGMLPFVIYRLLLGVVLLGLAFWMPAG